MQKSPRTQEIQRASPSGYLWVAIGIALFAAGIFLVVGLMSALSLALGIMHILVRDGRADRDGSAEADRAAHVV